MTIICFFHSHPRPFFHAVKLGDDDLVPIVECAAVHEDEIVANRERTPAVIGGVLGIHIDSLVPGVDVDAAVLRVVVLRRVFLDGKQIHVDPLRVENFAEQAERGCGDIDVILLIRVFRPLLVEEGAGFGEQSLPRDRQNLRVVLSEGEVIFPCLCRLDLRLGRRTDGEGSNRAGEEQPDDDRGRN